MTHDCCIRLEAAAFHAERQIVGRKLTSLPEALHFVFWPNPDLDVVPQTSLAELLACCIVLNPLHEG